MVVCFGTPATFQIFQLFTSAIRGALRASRLRFGVDVYIVYDSFFSIFNGFFKRLTITAQNEL